MTKKEFDNIVIFVSDALRYDYVPEEIAEDSKVIPTLAPSLHTPTSFASLFTARSPDKHNVKGFAEELDSKYKTAFDFFPNSSFYDGPKPLGTLNKFIFKSEGKDLEEVDEPFIWIERVMETHVPYGKVGHDREYEFEMSGREYVEKGKNGEIDLKSEYIKGINSLTDHFFTHIRELEEREILDNTLIILTSDHGELLGEKFLGKKRYDHNYPPMRQLTEVPTVFYNYNINVDCMRIIDIIPTALGISGADFEFEEGVDVRKNKVNTGINVMEDIKAKFKTKWEFKKDHWSPTFSSKIQIMLKTLIGDLKKSAYNRGYKKLHEKIEKNTKDEKTRDNTLEDIEI